MVSEDEDTEEPQNPIIDNGGTEPPQQKKRRRSFVKVRRELTEDELEASGVQKMLLDEVDRLEGTELDLKLYTEKFYDADTQLRVAEEKLKTHNAFEIISTGTVSIGSILFGAAFSWKSDNTLFLILIFLSLILIGVGIAAKVNRA